MHVVTSRDGTPIAIDRVGNGAPIVIVVGAFNERSTGAPLAAALESSFAVYNFDRRGRGDSGDIAPYEVESELEDLEAVIAEAGGSAGVFGYSSGGILALLGAARGLPITKVAVYDLPLVVGPPRWSVDHAAAIEQLVDSGRRGDAVEYFQARIVGIPDDTVLQLRHAPFRPALEAMAQTLVYEAILLGDGSLPADLAASIQVPALAIAGGASSPFMRLTAEAIADQAPLGRSLTLDGQTHDLDAVVLGPILDEFFGTAS